MDRMVELKRCISLVRTPNMSDAMIRDWLAVAMAEVVDLHPSAFRDGCAEARKTCKFPGEIVPTILNGKQSQWHKTNGSYLAPSSQRVALEHRGGGARRLGQVKAIAAPEDYITAEDLAAMKAERVDG